MRTLQSAGVRLRARPSATLPSGEVLSAPAPLSAPVVLSGGAPPSGVLVLPPSGEPLLSLLQAGIIRAAT
jgi:hypothetical protein